MLSKQGSRGHKSTKKQAQHILNLLDQHSCAEVHLFSHASELVHNTDTADKIVATSVSTVPIVKYQDTWSSRWGECTISLLDNLLLMLSTSMLPIPVIQQAADSILQLRLLTKDLLQALEYALLACLRCEQSLYQMGGGLDL